MFLILTFLLLLFFFPLTAWAYFDPGFGGYLINSIISSTIAGFAFVSAAVIYFFRTILGQKLFLLWQKHEKLCLIALLSMLGLGSFFLGTCLHRTFFTPLISHSHFSGARIIDSQRIFKGYSLYDGKLIDGYGRIVHQWPNSSFGVIDKNGDYYGQLSSKYSKGQYYKDAPWGRYTWDDKIIWEKDFFIHHEIYLSPKGTVFTFTKEVHDYNNYKVDFDIILEFDKNGKELQRFSFWDHLKEFQPYHAKFGIDNTFFPNRLLFMFQEEKPYENPSRGSYDYFHLNSFFMIPPNPLENKNPAFRPGNWLISIFHGSMVFILDQDTKRILWHAVANDIQGNLEGQHSASMLPNGNILLFENGIDRKASRILIIDPLTLNIKWQYTNTSFFSRTQGFVQTLPNGNLLVTESKKGHVFELTPDKKIVWTYDDTKNGDGDIYRMTRYPKEMIDHFLQGAKNELP